MSKKRGFTLTEVLVVIALTTLIMTMIGTAFVFVGTSSGNLIDKSEQLTQTQSIEMALRSLLDSKKNDKAYIKNFKGNTTDVKFDHNTKTLTVGNTEFKDTGLDGFRIYEKTETNEETGRKVTFVRCELIYDNNTIYDFILGLYVTTTTTP